jgi:hypothetical protein
MGVLAEQDLAGDEEVVIDSTLKNARFKVDNEFAGASAPGASSRQARLGPVEFDKEDVFGLDEFMQVLAIPLYFFYPYTRALVWAI